MRKKTNRIFLVLAVVLVLLLMPLTAQAASNTTPTYSCNNALQLLPSNLGSYLGESSCNSGRGAGEISVNSLPGQLDFLSLGNLSRYFNADSGSCNGLTYLGNSCSQDSGACTQGSSINGACSGSSCERSACDRGSCTDSSCERTSCTGSTCSDSAFSGSSCSGNSCSAPSKSVANAQSVNYAGQSQRFTPVNTQKATAVSSLVQEAVDLVNAERAKEGLAPLTLDASLCQAASIRVSEISGQFSHTRPNGTSCFTAFEEAGVSYMQAGENIALGQATARQVVTDWMNSPGHRANIMNPNFNRIGMAAVPSGDARYAGYAWAQSFAD